MTIRDHLVSQQEKFSCIDRLERAGVLDSSLYALLEAMDSVENLTLWLKKFNIEKGKLKNKIDANEDKYF